MAPKDDTTGRKGRKARSSRSKAGRATQIPERQRIRDPVHDLISFDMSSQLERTLWEVVCTPTFQRLRRIRQLGFSEFVYPGATHTRFAHSLGVFHTARKLLRVIRKFGKDDEREEHVALAAALLHDIGHGPFSHAFEAATKPFPEIPSDHEAHSVRLILDGEVRDILDRGLGKAFAPQVADLLAQTGKRTIYRSVVSSQFDADRLDYMHRDRLMAGTRLSGIDFEWLLDNLEVDEFAVGTDDLNERAAVYQPTFVIGPKAIHATEAYVSGLFQLYPTLYLHKTTRGAEKMFAALIGRAFDLLLNGSGKTKGTSLLAEVGLPEHHPIVRFARKPAEVDRYVALDDTVVWGALPLMEGARDKLIREFANRLRERRLYKCLDIRSSALATLDPGGKSLSSASYQHDEANRRIDECCQDVIDRLIDEFEPKSNQAPKVLVDSYTRSPYKRIDDEKIPTEQINVRFQGSQPRDLVDCSSVIAGLVDFKIARAYYDPDDSATRTRINDLLKEEAGRWKGRSPNWSWKSSRTREEQ